MPPAAWRTIPFWNSVAKLMNVIDFAAFVAFSVRVPMLSLLESLMPSTVIEPVLELMRVMPAVAVMRPNSASEIVRFLAVLPRPSVWSTFEPWMMISDCVAVARQNG